ncbi:unnamed protein product, partial [Ilex paraguariensis]
GSGAEVTCLVWDLGAFGTPKTRGIIPMLKGSLIPKTHVKIEEVPERDSCRGHASDVENSERETCRGHVPDVEGAEGDMRREHVSLSWVFEGNQRQGHLTVCSVSTSAMPRTHVGSLLIPINVPSAMILGNETSFKHKYITL